MNTKPFCVTSICEYWIIIYHISMWILNHLLNVEPYFVTSVCEHWIIFCHIGMWILNLLLPHQYMNTKSSSESYTFQHQCVNTEPSSVTSTSSESYTCQHQCVNAESSSASSVCEYWTIIIICKYLCKDTNNVNNHHQLISAKNSTTTNARASSA